jgi:hypothetical protein
MEGDLIAESYCLNWLAQREGKGGEGGRAWRGLRRRRAGLSREEGGRKEGDGREVDRWGRPVNETREKEKEKLGRGLPLGRAGGPPGQKGGEVSFLFFFSFSNSFQIYFKARIQIKIF